MKKTILLAATALLCASCFHVNKNFKGEASVVKGEGPAIIHSFDFRDFDRIEINGQGNVTFQQAETFSVSLCTQENILDYLSYRVEGRTLILESERHHTIRTDTYAVTVTAPVLTAITVNGAGNLDFPAGLRQEEDLKIEVNGAGDLSLSAVECGALSILVNGAGDIQADGLAVGDLRIEVNGAGDVTVSGKADNATLTVNGAGDIDARNLEVSGNLKSRAAILGKIKH